jgi:hypothetical protein
MVEAFYLHQKEQQETPKESTKEGEGEGGGRRALSQNKRLLLALALHDHPVSTQILKDVIHGSEKKLYVKYGGGRGEAQGRREREVTRLGPQGDIPITKWPKTIFGDRDMPSGHVPMERRGGSHVGGTWRYLFVHLLKSFQGQQK